MPRGKLILSLEKAILVGAVCSPTSPYKSAHLFNATTCKNISLCIKAMHHQTIE